MHPSPPQDVRSQACVGAAGRARTLGGGGSLHPHSARPVCSAARHPRQPQLRQPHPRLQSKPLGRPAIRPSHWRTCCCCCWSAFSRGPGRRQAEAQDQLLEGHVGHGWRHCCSPAAAEACGTRADRCRLFRIPAHHSIPASGQDTSDVECLPVLSWGPMPWRPLQLHNVWLSACKQLRQ